MVFIQFIANVDRARVEFVLEKKENGTMIEDL